MFCPPLLCKSWNGWRQWRRQQWQHILSLETTRRQLRCESSNKLVAKSYSSSKKKEYCPATVFTLFRASIPVWIGIRHTNPDLRPLTHTHLCPLYDYHVWPHSSYTSSRIVSLTQLCGLMICLGLVYYIITQMVFSRQNTSLMLQFTVCS